MELSNSFERSLKILRMLQSSDKIENSEKWFPSIWKNGREEGFCLLNNDHNIRIIFSECRNSDLMVIYFCNKNGFDINSQTITEEVYRSAIYCGSNEDAYLKILNLMRIENWI